jgi:lysophospholipase L1-like esterase
MHWIPLRNSWMAPICIAILLIGCGGDDTLENNNPGINDLNVVAAFGDSITQGNRCACAPYPARMGPMIGKLVPNAAIHGTMATAHVSRTQKIIDQNHPAFMLILYGVNDIIHGRGVTGIIGALDQMVQICKQNNVVPVLATYPVPFGSHRGFANGTIALNENIRLLAQAHSIKCVDLEREFAVDGGFPVADPTLMETDGLHPNDAGTQLMALAFADLF